MAGLQAIDRRKVVGRRAAQRHDQRVVADRVDDGGEAARHATGRRRRRARTRGRMAQVMVKLLRWPDRPRSAETGEGDEGAEWSASLRLFTW